MTEINLTYAVLTTWALGFTLPFIFPSIFGFNKKIDRAAAAAKPWRK